MKDEFGESVGPANANKQAGEKDISPPTPDSLVSSFFIGSAVAAATGIQS
jgi:hypothetical protein